MRRMLLPLLLCALLSGCSVPEAGHQFFAMDAPMIVTVYGKGCDEASSAVFHEINRLDALLSRTNQASEISLLNAAAGTAHTLTSETASLLQRSLDLSRDTGGAFDPVLAPIMDAWGFTGDTHRVPSGEELRALLPLTDPAGLTLHSSDSTATLAAGMSVDLGGIAKGYAADRSILILKEAGIASALLNLGNSTIAALGTRPDGNPWRIGVKDPKTQESYLCVLSLTDRTLSTSGAYERYFEQDGVIYHHIIDPSTGYPSDSDLLSATVVSSDGTLTDALSTALFVLGSDSAVDLWRTRSDFEFVLVLSDGVILVSEGLEQNFAFQGEEAGYRYEVVRR